MFNVLTVGVFHEYSKQDSMSLANFWASQNNQHLYLEA